MRQSVLPRRSGGSLGKVFDTVVIAMTLLVVGIAIKWGCYSRPGWFLEQFSCG